VADTAAGLADGSSGLESLSYRPKDNQIVRQPLCSTTSAIALRTARWASYPRCWVSKNVENCRDVA